MDINLPTKLRTLLASFATGKQCPKIFYKQKIYAINRNKLFFILYKLEFLLPFLKITKTGSYLKIKEWLKKRQLLTIEFMEEISIKSSDFKIINKIKNQKSNFLYLKKF